MLLEFQPRLFQGGSPFKAPFSGFVPFRVPFKVRFRVPFKSSSEGPLFVVPSRVP